MNTEATERFRLSPFWVCKQAIQRLLRTLGLEHKSTTDTVKSSSSASARPVEFISLIGHIQPLCENNSDQKEVSPKHASSIRLVIRKKEETELTDNERRNTK